MRRPTRQTSPPSTRRSPTSTSSASRWPRGSPPSTKPARSRSTARWRRRWCRWTTGLRRSRLGARRRTRSLPPPARRSATAARSLPTRARRSRRPSRRSPTAAPRSRTRGRSFPTAARSTRTAARRPTASLPRPSASLPTRAGSLPTRARRSTRSRSRRSMCWTAPRTWATSALRATRRSSRAYPTCSHCSSSWWRRWCA